MCLSRHPALRLLARLVVLAALVVGMALPQGQAGAAAVPEAQSAAAGDLQACQPGAAAEGPACACHPPACAPALLPSGAPLLATAPRRESWPVTGALRVGRTPETGTPPPKPLLRA